MRVAVLLALAASASSAAEPAPAAKTFSLRGFGTLGVAGADVQGADFVGHTFQDDGVGAAHRWSAGVDSKVGLQVDALFSERFTAVAQVVAQQRYDGSYTPQIEWANLKFQVTPDFSLRVGRTVADLFMVSDARLVGYVSPWVRPPQEVYGVAPFTNKDGVDIAYRFAVGEAINTVRGSFGQATLKIPRAGQAGEVKGRDVFDLNHTFEYGPSSLRVGYMSARGELRNPDLSSLFGGFSQFGAAVSAIPGLESVGEQAFALVERYQFSDFPYTLMTVGASYDQAEWLFMAEWAQAKSSGLVLDSAAWYALGGYRVGKFTPYLIYAQLTADKPFEPGISLAGLPAPLAQAAAALNGGLQAAIDQSASEQNTVAVGVRWDLWSRAALKLQYDNIDLGAGSRGRLANVQPTFEVGTTVGVFSAVVDFVF